jgi:hypothetical protein
MINENNEYKENLSYFYYLLYRKHLDIKSFTNIIAIYNFMLAFADRIL